MLAGLGVLIGGMIISFQNKVANQFFISIGALVVGFILSQIGIYYTNRWGRRPRPDEILDVALKGLDNQYTLYHYKTSVSHLLVGPSGFWILIPKQQGGTITYSDGRYRQKGGNLYLKIFAQDSIGRPDLDVRTAESELMNFINEKLGEDYNPNISSALVFTNPKVTVDVSEEDGPPAITTTAGKIKNVIRKETKNKRMAKTQVDAFNSLFGIE